MKHKSQGSIKNTLTLSACALAVWVATSMPAMAESVDLAVTGTIIPAACVPLITGEIKYDNVTAAQLDDKAYTVLDKKEVDFAIDCAGPVKVAIKAINGQPGAVAGGGVQRPDTSQKSPVDLLGNTKPQVIGLGAHEGVAIGGYALALVADGLSADGQALVIMGRSEASDVWGSLPGDFVSLYHVNENDWIYSWAGAGDPVAIEKLTGRLAVQAYLNNTTELEVDRAIQLNGLATIELVYL